MFWWLLCYSYRHNSMQVVGIHWGAKVGLVLLCPLEGTAWSELKEATTTSEVKCFLFQRAVNLRYTPSHCHHYITFYFMEHQANKTCNIRWSNDLITTTAQVGSSWRLSQLTRRRRRRRRRRQGRRKNEKKTTKKPILRNFPELAIIVTCTYMRKVQNEKNFKKSFKVFV